MRRAGVADLPLHYGRVPDWLASRMVTLGTAIVESVVYHYGRPAFLARLSDPFWFQAFGSVLGMDWHSSGITTSVMGALKKGLNGKSHELGIFICGGREAFPQHASRATCTGGSNSLDGDSLVRISRLTARVDNNAIADGFQIYLHSFVLTAEGEWAIVQQGNERGQPARSPLPLAFRVGTRLHRRPALRNRGRTRRPGHESRGLTCAHRPGRAADDRA